MRGRTRARASRRSAAGIAAGRARRVATEPLQVGLRNSERWGDFYTLDLRGSWTWQFASGDLSVVLDVTNATNRRNECCAGPGDSEETSALEAEVDHWLPTIVNIGFTYRWRSSPLDRDGSAAP